MSLIICEECEGSGYEPHTRRTCEACEGSGTVANPLDAEIARLKAELAAKSAECEQAMAESAAVVGAAQELSIGVGLPRVVIGKVRKPDGTVEDWAIPASEIHTLQHAILRRIEDCAGLGVAAVEAYHKLSQAKHDIADLRAKLAASEADAAKMREALEWYGNCGGVPYQDDSHERAIAALATNAGAEWLTKYRAMERVCEAASKTSAEMVTELGDFATHEELDAALNAYRALCAKEQGYGQ